MHVHFSWNVRFHHVIRINEILNNLNDSIIKGYALSYNAGLQIHFLDCIDAMVIFLVVIKVTFKGDKWLNK